ncbi:MAG: hypothetical protein ACK5N8_05985 [Alphaproteobacteria bacterium]
MTELHCFVVWHNARGKEKEIEQDIKSKFKILNAYEVFWEKNAFLKNLQMMYGKNIIKTWKKERKIGKGSFLLYKVLDENPIHQAEDNKNINILKAKKLYREMTGGGHLIHASDTEIEAREHLNILLNQENSSNISKYSFATQS